MERDATGGLFFLRCPTCDGPDGIGTAADLAVPAYAQLLGTARTYKPAMLRLETAVAAYFRQALADRNPRCLLCGGPAQLWTGRRQAARPHHSSYEVRAWCDACGWGSNSSLFSLFMSLPEGRQFRQEHPKIRTLPTLEVEAQGVPALVTRVQSATSTAGLAVVSARETFAVLAIDPSPDL
jgi:hypothetical protein